MKLGQEVDREKTHFRISGFTAELGAGKLVTMATRKRAAAAKTTASKSPRKAGKLAPSKIQRGPTAAEIACGIDAPALASLAALIREAGGAPLGGHLDPFGGPPITLANPPPP